MMGWTCTLDETDLGVVEDLSVTNESSLTCFDDPDTITAEQEFSDDNGAKRSYNIQGSYNSTTWTNVVNWKNVMSSKISGSQYADSQNHTFVIYDVDENIYIEDNINVMLESFEYKMKAGDAPNCSYTLKFYQSVPL